MIQIFRLQTSSCTTLCMLEYSLLSMLLDDNLYFLSDKILSKYQLSFGEIHQSYELQALELHSSSVQVLKCKNIQGEESQLGGECQEVKI